MSNFLTRALRTVTDAGTAWPTSQGLVPAEQYDGAVAAEYHASQRAEQAEKERDHMRGERDGAMAANLLLCTAGSLPAGEPASTPIGDQLADELGYEGWA